LTESDLPLLSVSGLNRLVSQAIGQKFPLVRLNAELSQVMQAASGHWYLTLKDSQASLRAVLFRREAAGLAFRPAEGMQVELRVVPGLYEPKGEFQVRVSGSSA
jgi:exodeoxyribonuclease VII large subunit